MNLQPATPTDTIDQGVLAHLETSTKKALNIGTVQEIVNEFSTALNDELPALLTKLEAQDEGKAKFIFAFTVGYTKDGDIQAAFETEVKPPKKIVIREAQLVKGQLQLL